MKSNLKKSLILVSIFTFLVLGILLKFLLNPSSVQKFDGARAMKDAGALLDLGPRIPGSITHGQAVAFIRNELEQAGWKVSIQEGQSMGHPIRNIIARRGETGPWYILGSHYDSRMVADHDPDPEKRSLPVPGANDGVSTTAILLELARVLPANLDKQIWLVFFDAEDQGGIPGWDWILGSRYFADSLEGQPDGVVIIDMVGDADLQIYYERNSSPPLQTSIWQVAQQAGFSEFNSEIKFSILDDHIPFLQKNISAIDIIDFDYPYYHTTADTLDKISKKSLFVVGETLRLWLTNP